MDKRSTVFSRYRRFSQRHKFKTALRVRVWKSGLPEERAESMMIAGQAAGDSNYSTD